MRMRVLMNVWKQRVWDLKGCVAGNSCMKDESMADYKV